MIPDFEKFEPLRRLLALKRYEHPPADYFKGFSSQVIARIQAGEKAEDPVATGRLFWEVPWLKEIWASFQTKPTLVGAFGAAVCATVIFGLIYAEKPELAGDSSNPKTEYIAGGDVFQPARQAAGPVQSAAVWSTEPVNLAPQGEHRSLFDEIPKLQTAIWIAPSGN